MKITPYKQTTWQSCLPVCLLSVSWQLVTREMEHKLFLEGMQAHRDNWYMLSMLEAFTSHFPHTVTVTGDNTYFVRTLKKLTSNPLIQSIEGKIADKILQTQSFPFILYLDSHVLWTFVRAPHFIVVESIDGSAATIMDPHVGKRKQIPLHELIYGTISLWEHLHFCPIIIEVNQL